jgi:hypothetical protein
MKAADVMTRGWSGQPLAQFDRSSSLASLSVVRRAMAGGASQLLELQCE